MFLKGYLFQKVVSCETRNMVSQMCRESYTEKVSTVLYFSNRELTDSVTVPLISLAPCFQSRRYNSLSQLPPEALSFFAQSSVFHCQIFLNSILEYGRIDCMISSANGSIVNDGWKFLVVFVTYMSIRINSISYIFKRNFSTTLLIYFMCQGQGYLTRHEISAVSLQKLTKSQIHFP